MFRGTVNSMKPSERFAKKVWKKPPKNEAKGHKMPNKSGITKCAVCKSPIAGSKRKLLRKNYSPAKSTIRPNKPYGGYLCTSCLKKEAIKETRALAAEE